MLEYLPLCRIRKQFSQVISQRIQLSETRIVLRIHVHLHVESAGNSSRQAFRWIRREIPQVISQWIQFSNQDKNPPQEPPQLVALSIAPDTVRFSKNHLPVNPITCAERKWQTRCAQPERQILAEIRMKKRTDSAPTPCTVCRTISSSKPVTPPFAAVLESGHPRPPGRVLS